MQVNFCDFFFIAFRLCSSLVSDIHLIEEVDYDLRLKTLLTL